MARSKQPAMKREASSEYFNKKTSTWEDSAGGKEAIARSEDTNGVAKENGRPADNAITEDKGAGLVQLVIAVSGIYASLYVCEEEQYVAEG